MTSISFVWYLIVSEPWEDMAKYFILGNMWLFLKEFWYLISDLVLRVIAGGWNRRKHAPSICKWYDLVTFDYMSVEFHPFRFLSIRSFMPMYFFGYAFSAIVIGLRSSLFWGCVSLLWMSHWFLFRSCIEKPCLMEHQVELHKITGTLLSSVSWVAMEDEISGNWL